MSIRKDEDYSIIIANPAGAPVGIYFSHSDNKRVLDITKEEWRGLKGSIVSDNIIDAIFEIVEDKNLNQEKAIKILKEHGFFW